MDGSDVMANIVVNTLLD